MSNFKAENVSQRAGLSSSMFRTPNIPIGPLKLIQNYSQKLKKSQEYPPAQNKKSSLSQYRDMNTEVENIKYAQVLANQDNHKQSISEDKKIIQKQNQNRNTNHQEQIRQQIQQKEQQLIKKSIQDLFDRFIENKKKQKGIKENRNNNEQKKKILASPKILEARKGLDQLGLNYLSTNDKDVSELTSILGLILNYPSTNQAVSHARANVLGTYDLITPQQFDLIQKGIYQPQKEQQDNDKKHRQKIRDIFNQNIDFDEKLKIFERNEPPKPKNCPCCGLPEQIKKVKVWQDLHLVSHVGIAVNLFFMAIKNVIILLAIMTVLFSSFAMASNMKSYQIFEEAFNKDIFNETDISNITDFSNADATASNFASNLINQVPPDLSGLDVDQAIINSIAGQVINKYELNKIGNKILIQLQRSSLAGKYYLQGDSQNRYFARRSFFAECWLGAGVLVIWIFFLAYLRYRQKVYHILIERLTTTASDFTLLFQNIPKYYAANDKIIDKFEKVLESYLRQLEEQTIKGYNIKLPKKKQPKKKLNNFTDKKNNKVTEVQVQNKQKDQKYSLLDCLRETFCGQQNKQTQINKQAQNNKSTQIKNNALQKQGQNNEKGQTNSIFDCIKQAFHNKQVQQNKSAQKDKQNKQDQNKQGQKIKKDQTNCILDCIKKTFHNKNKQDQQKQKDKQKQLQDLKNKKDQKTILGRLRRVFSCLNNKQNQKNNQVTEIQQVPEKKQPIQIKIKKVNFIFFFDKKEYYDPKNDFEDPQIKQYNKHIEDCRKQFIQTLLKRKKNHNFHISEKSRKSLLYDRWNNLQDQKKKRHQQIREQKLQEAYYDVKVEKKFENLSAFVTFKNTSSKQIMKKLHNDQDSFLRKLSFYKEKNFIKFPHQTGFQEVRVTFAPQPEDIVWESYQKTDRQAFLRKTLTYTVVTVILGLSFFSVYKMTQLQINQSKAAIRGQTISEADQNMSVYISLLLNFINTKLSFIIRYMSKFECNRTYTGQQRSMAIKTIMALCVNSIAIPLFMTILFNKSMYGQNGLADNVLFQALINCLVNPIQKIINPNYFMLKIKKVKGAQPQEKLNLTQEQLNSKYEEAQFQVGYEYSNLIFMYLFACFYATLQPAVVGITAAGLILYYWSQKTYFLRFTKRPRKGTKEVNDYMFYIICLGPLCYTAGSVFWSFDIYGPQSKIPNLICFILSLVIFFFPYTSVVYYVLDSKIKQAENFFPYDEERIFLATEYDRLNPYSKKEAQRTFIQYQIEFIKELNKKYAFKKQFEYYQQALLVIDKLKQNQQKKAKKQKQQKFSEEQKQIIKQLKTRGLMLPPDMTSIQEQSKQKQEQIDSLKSRQEQQEQEQEQQQQYYQQQEQQQQQALSKKWRQQLQIIYKRKFKNQKQIIQPQKKEAKNDLAEFYKQYTKIIEKNRKKYLETKKYINYVKRKMKYLNFFGISNQNNEYEDQQQQQQQHPYIRVTVDANNIKQEGPFFTMFHQLYKYWLEIKKKKKEQKEKIKEQEQKEKKQEQKYKNQKIIVQNQEQDQDSAYSKIGFRLFLGDFDSGIEIVEPPPKQFNILQDQYDFSNFEKYKYENDEAEKKKKRKLIQKKQQENMKKQKDLNNKIEQKNMEENTQGILNPKDNQKEQLSSEHSLESSIDKKITGKQRHSSKK